MAHSQTAGVVTEAPVPGAVPRYEVPGWRERFGVVAGTTGRRDAEGRDFDLGLWSRQAVGEVMARWRAFRRAEPGFGATVFAHQVHGPEVLVHREARGWVVLEGADGHVTAEPGIMLAVTVADCIPVYLLEPRSRAIALLHAGWRGTAAGVLARGVRLLCDAAGATSADLVMHVGIGICGPCYEVGAEVMTGVGLAAEGAGPWHVDLRERLVEQAADLGVGETTRSGWCTAHDRDRFHSHRASGGSDGRMVAYLGVPGADGAGDGF